MGGIDLASLGAIGKAHDFPYGDTMERSFHGGGIGSHDAPVETGFHLACLEEVVIEACNWEDRADTAQTMEYDPTGY